MHGEWTPHAHLNKDVSEVFVSHRGGAREKRCAPRRSLEKEKPVRSQNRASPGVTGRESRVCPGSPNLNRGQDPAVPGVFLPGVPAPPGFADVGDSSCADVGDSRPTIYDHPSRYSVATCIVLQCP